MAQAAYWLRVVDASLAIHVAGLQLTPPPPPVCLLPSHMCTKLQCALKLEAGKRLQRRVLCVYLLFLQVGQFLARYRCALTDLPSSRPRSPGSGRQLQRRTSCMIKSGFSDRVKTNKQTKQNISVWSASSSGATSGKRLRSKLPTRNSSAKYSGFPFWFACAR